MQSVLKACLWPGTAAQLRGGNLSPGSTLAPKPVHTCVVIGGLFAPLMLNFPSAAT